MRNKAFEIASVMLLTLTTQSIASECKIMTSQLDHAKMNFEYSNWYARSIDIINATNFKLVSFSNAYQMFDASLRSYVKESICTNERVDGVANYKIQWQQTDKAYNFTATYDVFSNK